MNILVSACLLGYNCKYNGGNNYINGIEELEHIHTVIPVCPEMLGGLPCPRKPSEIKCGRVFSRAGDDVTIQFTKGAELTLKTATENGVTTAILKARSPSCGYGEIYDGSFRGTVTRGNGITAELLLKNGIKIYTEHNWRNVL